MNNVFGKHSAIFILVISLWSGSTWAQNYAIEEVDGLATSAINSSAQLTGFVPGTSASAAIWDSGRILLLQPSNFTDSFGNAINDTGEVVGAGVNSQNMTEGFAWNPTMEFFTPSPSLGQSEFYTVNNTGIIGGSFLATGSLGSGVAAIWTTAGTMTTLPSLAGANDSRVSSLNDAGQAIGSSGLSGFDNWPADPSAPYADDHAALWENGQVIDLTPGDPWSDAYAINNAGQVVGYRMIVVGDDMVSVPFIWDSTHGLADLPYYGLESFAADINDEGQVVGSTADPNDPSNQIAALWQNGVLYNLNDLLPADSGWVLENATGINDSGDIIGSGMYDGQEEGFLLTPTGDISIPEPAAIPLAAGFCLLAFRRRRKGSSEDGQ